VPAARAARGARPALPGGGCAGRPDRARACALPRVLRLAYVDCFQTGLVSTVPAASAWPSPARTCATASRAWGMLARVHQVKVRPQRVQWGRWAMLGPTCQEAR